MKIMKIIKKGKRNLFLLGALALALVITGGIFAGAWFMHTGQDSPTLEADFADVTVDATKIGTLLPDPISGGTWGNVTAQSAIFTITPDAAGTGNYTGDLRVTLYLADAGELSQSFQHLNIEVTCSDTTGGGAAQQLLGLDNAKVAFPVSGYSAGASITISTIGGSYHAYDTIEAFSGDLTLYCEVSPRGINQ